MPQPIFSGSLLAEDALNQIRGGMAPPPTYPYRPQAGPSNDYSINPMDLAKTMAQWGITGGLAGAAATSGPGFGPGALEGALLGGIYHTTDRILNPTVRPAMPFSVCHPQGGSPSFQMSSCH